jgi:EamA domain-containing membrane protein RarD
MQNLAFLPNLWQFCIDLAVMGVSFTFVQVAGFSMLFLFYALVFANYLLKRRLRNVFRDSSFAQA